MSDYNRGTWGEPPQEEKEECAYCGKEALDFYEDHNKWLCEDCKIQKELCFNCESSDTEFDPEFEVFLCKKCADKKWI